ncbi:hypothetical protein V8D89_006659 [Ganoderma adspersum]
MLMVILRGFDVTDALTWIYKPSLAPHRRTAHVPGLRHLALSGVQKLFAVLMLKHVCPHVETLELTHPAAGQLPPLAPLPPATRTLVLRYPVVGLCRTQMAAWGLPEALERGLFPRPPSSADLREQAEAEAGADCPPFGNAWQPYGRLSSGKSSKAYVPTPFSGILIRHVCPYLETLELTRPAAGQLPVLVSLPPTVRAPVLRYPGVALSKKDLAAWMVPEALETELFPPSNAELAKGLKPARIVVCSGTPEPLPFIELWREYKRFNVEFVYEHDDSRSPVAPQRAHPKAKCAYTDPLPGALNIIRGWM